MGQVTQAVAPCEPMYVPTLHCVHTAVPLVGANVPSRQLRQSVSRDERCTGLAFPAAQATHEALLVRPSSGLYDPAGQLSKTASDVAPAPLQNPPLAHEVHVDWPDSALKVPLAQLAHDAAPVVFENWPGGQGISRLAPSMQSAHHDARMRG